MDLSIDEEDDMTLAKQRTIALIVAFILAIGCALAISMPQQAYATKSTKLAAGSSFTTSNNLALTDRDLAATNSTKFNATNDNNFYKFTTSDRNSRYRLTLRSFDGWRLYATIYDASHHRIAHMATSSTTGQNWVFRNLKRNAVYYIEVWRFVINVSDYIDSGTVLGEGYAESTYVPYRITVKELVTPPKKVTGLKFRSTAKGTLRVTYRESNTAEGYRIEIKRGSGSWQFKGFTQKTSITLKNLKTTGKYKVRVRAARWVNGKKYYSDFVTTTNAIKANGKTTKWKS